jgi:hypothetical protein
MTNLKKQVIIAITVYSFYLNKVNIMSFLTPLTKNIENVCFDLSTRNSAKSSPELIIQNLPAIGSPSAKMLLIANLLKNKK